MASFQPQSVVQRAAIQLAPPPPPPASIFWELPIPLQKHVLGFLPPADQATLRTCCTYARALVNDLVQTLTLGVNPYSPLENRSQLRSISYEPLVARFPCTKALHITTLNQWRAALDESAPPPDPQGDLITLLEACAPFIRRCTSFTLTCYSGPDTSPDIQYIFQPQPRLLAALRSVLTPAAATLTHLHIAFPSRLDFHFVPPPPYPLPLLLPTVPLPALARLHVTANLDAAAPAPPLPPAPRLQALSLAKLPLAAAHLPAAYPTLTALTLEFAPVHQDPPSTPHLLPFTALTALARLRIDGGAASLRAPATAPLAALRSLSSLTLFNWRLLHTDGLYALSHPPARLQRLTLEKVRCEAAATLAHLSRLTSLTSLEIALDYGQRRPGLDLGLSRLGPLAGSLQQFVIEGLSSDDAPHGFEDLPPALWAMLQPDHMQELPFGELLFEGLFLDEPHEL